MLPKAIVWRELREAVDYGDEFSQSGAKAVIASAEEFIEKATAVLDISILGT